ncbi:glycoside hydrolase family 113 [Pediococcus pentosaceus]|uniref:glycoside hydrolase family 113 n=1 Tax=Pediococcus pentosaceus TaxID=1255 RepID=UPI0040375AE7
MAALITLDTQKQQNGVSEAFNIQELFNARVGDEQVPFSVKFLERGKAQQFEDGLVPFMSGFVGNLDDDGKVTAETGEPVSYTGSRDDIVGLGMVKMNLPGMMFPQEGYFYGFLGLETPDHSKRVSTFSVWFHVYNGNPDMFVNKEPFRSELQKELDYAELLIKQVDEDGKAKLKELEDMVNDLITDKNIDLGLLESRMSTAEGNLKILEDKIKADGLLTLAEFEEFKNQIMLDATNRIGELEKIVGRNYLTYKTISSTLYSIGDGISDDNINAILRVGGTLAMPIMVTVTSSTDPNIVMQSDDRVQQNIDHIKGKGLEITMLKPHIGLAGGYDGLNRATYEPSDFDVFFKNWKGVMLHYAETCNANGIPILCIGCEQEKCTDPKYIANWVDIYQSIKAKYPNLLITYAMEGNEAKDIDGHGQIAQAVDLVGINAYPNYINKDYDDSVTQDELIAGWYFEQDGNHYMDMFDNYVEKYDKPIFVTETGSMPWKDGLARLLSLQEGDQDFSGQAAAYQATFEAFSQNPNIVGISIWNTNAPFNFTSPSKTTESELVLKKYFKGGLI